MTLSTSASSCARCASATNDPGLLTRHVPCVAETTAFVAEHDLVPMLDDPVEVVRMPEFGSSLFLVGYLE